MRLAVVALLLASMATPELAVAASNDTALTEGRRIALVIGNGSYANVGHLANPTLDAEKMGQLFKDAGFSTVDVKDDLNENALRHVLADFQALATGADVAVVYFSGHGIEYKGRNYLVPIDAELKREVDIDDETISLDRVLDTVAGASKLKLVILDACRTDPFKTLTSTRTTTRGLARIEPTEANELVAYSARAGTVAQDGEPGGDSPYTAALLRRLRTPGLDVELALRRVRDDVLSATHGEQAPFYYGSIGGEEIAVMPMRPAALQPAGAAAEIILPLKSPVLHSNTAHGIKERAALLLDAPDDPQKVKTFVGTVVWQSEDVKAGQDQPTSQAVQADIDIPDVGLKLTMLLQKNYEAKFPASHTIDLRFAAAPNSAVGRVKQINVPQMREDDKPKGDPLVGLPVTITGNYFLVGLSRGDAAAQNLDLIESRNWFDIPILMESGKVAKITFEEGETGRRVIKDVTTVWLDPASALK